MTRRTKLVCWSLLGAAALGVAVLGTGIVLLRSEWFRNQVRDRIVSVTERATGGHVEIGRFSYNWRALTAEVSPFVLHGAEPASAPPLLRAEKIEIRLRIISLFEKKVDVSSLLLDHPSVNVVVAADGSTNIPRPKASNGRGLMEQLLNLKARHIALRQAEVTYNSWKLPIDAAGDDLQVSLRYEPDGPRYLCSVSSSNARITSPELKAPLEFSVDSQLVFARNSIQIVSANLNSEKMKFHTAGQISDLAAPHAELDLSASVPVADLSKLVRMPIEPRGTIDLQGHVAAGSPQGKPLYNFTGKLTGKGLGYVLNGVETNGVSVASRLDASPAGLRLQDLDIVQPQGHFHGTGQLAALPRTGQRLSLKGTLDAYSIAELGRLLHKDTGNLSGVFSGSVQLDGAITPTGLASVTASADVLLKPGEGGLPMQGNLALSYDQRTHSFQLGATQLMVGATQATVSGVIGQTLAVSAVSRDLNDVIPVLRALGASPPTHWPVELRDGVARVDASVSGSLANAKVSGKADVERLRVDGHLIDRFVTTFGLTGATADLQAFSVQEGKTHLEGQGHAGLHNWKLEGSSPVSALATLRNGDLQALAAQAGIESVPASGAVSATVRVSGSFESPLINGNVSLDDLTAYDERFTNVRAAVSVTSTELELSNGEARVGASRVALSGSYNHPAQDWKDGSLRFDIGTSGLDLTQVKHVQEFESALGGRLDVKANGAAKIVNGRFDLTSLNGKLSVRSATLEGLSYGDIEITAATKLPMLAVTATARMQDLQLRGSGEWRMEGDYQGQAHVQIPRITFATMHDLMPGKHLRKDLPFAGFVEGEASISGPLNQPAKLKADVTLSTVQLNASPNTRPLGGVQPQDLVLKSAQPIHLTASGGVVDIGHASFVAKDTTLEAAGRVALNTKSPWDLTIQGRINFSILELFNPDLLGSGASIIDVAVRGPLMEPQVEGRLELRNVSLFLRNVPNGIDQANGLILFDRNRATVQNLTAETGGGEIKFDSGSFVGFRGEGLVYRLQAAAHNVRYRSISGVSMTMDGALSLVGTSASSVLAGSVSVTRAAFNPRTDVGALLASTAAPVAEVTQNDYLNGVQLDVHIITTRTLEVETSLTRNIQADADVRLRGTTDRPVLLGHITVNSGQVEFFGNKYTINRGEVNFNNPAKIEPNINMDLSTRVRGITVNISFSGSLNKLNFSYRSDPPLEASDIIALLAVGRAPAAAGPLASSQSANNLNSSFLGTSSNSLLSQAIAPNQGRLQKFFGVGHIKIDPQLTDITIVPQARLTMEQQVSSDITLTYITNLAVTNQQIVRVQWDFSSKWSAVALRDENGAFSVDFQYRKRFK
jgi:translocation and assembly module TamB